MKVSTFQIQQLISYSVSVRAFVGQTTNLGTLILPLEDENGFEKEFNFGLFYLVNGAREISYVNPEYVYYIILNGDQ